MTEAAWTLVALGVAGLLGLVVFAFGFVVPLALVLVKAALVGRVVRAVIGRLAARPAKPHPHERVSSARRPTDADPAVAEPGPAGEER